MAEARFQHPDALVSGSWLEAHLYDPDLRIFDCTYHLLYGQSEEYPYRYISGRADYDAGHIPGADFLDLQEEFSTQDSPYLISHSPKPSTVHGCRLCAVVGPRMAAASMKPL